MMEYCSWCHQSLESHRVTGQTTLLTPTKPLACPECRREITLITIRRACEIVCKSRQTIYRWIRQELVSTLRSANGQQLICLSSLFVATAQAVGEQAAFRNAASQSQKTVSNSYMASHPGN
jgi:uncharacterized protein YbaR (Trm112 family)